MTILEDDVISLRPHQNKYKTNNIEQIKRKYSFEESSPPKKRAFDMLNGYQKATNGGSAPSDPPVSALSNMGNTCFLNSVLYTLRFAPTFLHNLHHLINDLAVVGARLNQNKAKTSSLGRNVAAITGPSSRSTSSKDLLSLGGPNNDLMPKSKVQVVTEKLHELFQLMHNLETKDSPDPYQPVALLQAVKEANSIFEGNNQQDAHELLVYLLDNIRETGDVLAQQVQQYPELLNEASTETTPANNSRIWTRRPWTKGFKRKDKTPISEEHTNGTNSKDNGDSESIGSNNGATGNRKIGYNFVAEDFEGITLRRTKCLECECVTERKEPFYDIPVPIPVRDDDVVVSVNDVHDIFRKACVTTEKLCDANKYLCETCSRYNEASREVLFEKLPNMMVLQLKRFTTTTSGVQKVNTYLPTPLVLRCFCESCCKTEDPAQPPHRYHLCCVIMHLGGSMASGHYIAYVRAPETTPPADYADCPRDPPKGSLSASSSEKALNIVNKLLKPRAAGLFGSNGGGFIDARNGLASSKSVAVHGMRVCKSIDCCGLRVNRHFLDAGDVAAASKKSDRSPPPSRRQTTDGGGADVWLECDDENVRPITTEEFVEELSFKPNSTSTPYLLFYAKKAAAAATD